MQEEVKILLEVVDKASGKIAKVTASTADLDRALGKLVQAEKNTAVMEEATRHFGKMSNAEKDAMRATQELEESQRSLGKTQNKIVGSLTELKSGIDLVSMAFRTIKQAGQQAFEFGRSGAELDYTKDKFDSLAASIGTTSEALERDLRAATRDMVADSKLFGSATDFMGLGLTKTHDQTVRLTKAAGALGMNMNQLVLTLTNQTTMRFDALGVRVDGFDERLKRLKETGMDTNAAFTEAFLQQAEAQIALIGERADSGTASFDRLETSVQNISDTLGRRYSPAMADAADHIDRVLRVQEKLNKVLQEGGRLQFGGILPEAIAIDVIREKLDAANDALLRQSSSWHRGVEQANEFTEAATEQADAFESRINPAVDELNKKLTAGIITQDSYKRELMKLASAGQLVAGASDYSARSIQKYSYEAYAARTASMEMAEKIDFVSKKLSSASGGADAAARALGKMIDQTNRNVGSAIGSMIKDLEWLMGGGGEIEQAFTAVMKAIQEGKITPAEGKKALEGLFIAATDLQLELNQIDAKTAASNIEETLNMKLKDANQLVKDLIGRSGSTIDLTVLMRLVTLGTIPGGGNTSPANAPGKSRGPIAQAQGGDWWVTRPTLFMAGEAGPERATFTPQGQAGPASSRGDVYFGDIIVIAGPGQSGAAAMRTGRQVRRAIQAGAGYAQ